MNIALFPGSFDPITNGHEDIINRALPLFDKLVIGVGINADKKYMFEITKRIEFIQNAFVHEPKIAVQAYSGLTVDFCETIGAKYILRGLRNPADFEFEKAIAHTNRHLNKNIEMVFLLTSSGKSFISSSIVRDVIRNNGSYKNFVPASVIL